MSRRYATSSALLFCASLCFSWPSAASLLAQDKPAPVTEIKGDARTPLAGTKKLEMEGDIAAQLVDGVDKFLLREIEKSVEGRAKFWKRDLSSPEAYNKSIEPNRKRLAHILGVRDKRELLDTVDSVSLKLVATADKYKVFRMTWRVFRDLTGEGLLLVPNVAPKLNIIYLPDADQTPEQVVGLVEGFPQAGQYARALAENGYRVIVPVLIDRKLEPRRGRGNISGREFAYRPAFELGRHLIGYEVQKTLAAVDWLEQRADGANSKLPIGVYGYGEGGAIALYSGALDTRIQAVGVSGYFGPREKVWEQPIDRNVFGLLEQFGDAELAAMIAPRSVFVEHAKAPEVDLPGSGGGAPAKLERTPIADVQKEFDRATDIVNGIAGTNPLRLTFINDAAAQDDNFVSYTGLLNFVRKLESLGKLASDFKFPMGDSNELPVYTIEEDHRLAITQRQQRQQHEIEADTQYLLRESEYVRNDYMKKLYDSQGLDAYNKNVEEYREKFATEVIGRFDIPLTEPAPRSRKAYETEKWTGYEVVLDVWPDVIAYGILILPKDLKEGEKRPVVVCQHGLEGRPQDTIGEPGFQYYSAFAGRLAERGFITFSPQNLYIGKDRFRTLQRKANPLGKTLFSVIVPQHQQICNWLGTLPMVDKDRIAFYGLSYGGKSAMRIPPLVKNYCLSICSADFNEWVAKNASTRLPFSYVWTGEYEIFEFDLGSTFNYSEMAALICPRPFMVERGHTDGVSEDWWVSYEYAKVFYNYSHRLKLADRCELEVFDGPHKINGVKTYEFLHKHLKWPAPK